MTDKIYVLVQVRVNKSYKLETFIMQPLNQPVST